MRYFEAVPVCLLANYDSVPAIHGVTVILPASLRIAKNSYQPADCDVLDTFGKPCK